MDNRSRSLTYAILFAGLSASVLGVIGFLNTAYADNQNMTDNMNMNATATASSAMTGNNNMTNSTQTPYLPPPAPVVKMMDPLQQFKAGTPAKTVQCGQGLSLVIKVEDGSPACVSSASAQVLVARGWGTTA